MGQSSIFASTYQTSSHSSTSWIIDSEASNPQLNGDVVIIDFWIKYCRVMDWDLWDSSYTEGSNCLMGNERECDLLSIYDLDVIEEDALNKKYCVQVLKILISKADIEIEGLEDHLLILQNQVKWAEHKNYEEWYDICCKGLQEKINSLDFLIRSVKNETVQNQHDADVQLQTHSTSVNKVSEIVQALLRKHCQQKVEQPKDIIFKDFRSDSFRHASGHNNYKQKLNNFDLSTSRMEEDKELGDSQTDKSSDLNLFLKPQVKGTNLAEIVKVQQEARTGVDEQGPSVIPTDNSSSLNLLLKPKEERTNTEVTVEVQEVSVTSTEFTIPGSPLKLQEHSAKNVIKSESLEVEESRTAVKFNSVSLNSSLKSQRRIAKRNVQSTPIDVQDHRVPPEGIGSKSSSNLKGKGKQRSSFTHTNHSISLKSPSNGKRMKRKGQPIPVRVQDPRVATYDNYIFLNALPKSQYNRGKSINQPDALEVTEPCITFSEFSVLQGDTTESMSKEALQLSRSSDIDDSDDKITGTLPTCENSDLNASTLMELKALAKQCGLKGYTKMRKALLIELLTKKES